MESDTIQKKTLEDLHTKEIDLVNRDPKHLNDHVVKVRLFFLSLVILVFFLPTHHVHGDFNSVIRLLVIWIELWSVWEYMEMYLKSEKGFLYGRKRGRLCVSGWSEFPLKAVLMDENQSTGWRNSVLGKPSPVQGVLNTSDLHCSCFLFFWIELVQALCPSDTKVTSGKHQKPKSYPTLHRSAPLGRHFLSSIMTCHWYTISEACVVWDAALHHHCWNDIERCGLGSTSQSPVPFPAPEISS